MKTCNKCGDTKDDEEFRPKRRVCKDCERAHGRTYRRNNNKAKQWAEANKDRMKKLQANWYQTNKEKINTTFRERYHDTSSDFKKIKNYRTALSHMLGGEQKTNQHVGCHVERLKDWCDYCFEKGMTLDNYGDKWVVDHVIPLDTEEDFALLAKWYNIIPTREQYNLEKNKYIDIDRIMIHMENVRSYFEDRKLKLDQEYMELLAKHLDAGNP